MGSQHLLLGVCHYATAAKSDTVGKEYLLRNLVVEITRSCIKELVKSVEEEKTAAYEKGEQEDHGVREVRVGHVPW